MMDLGEKRWLQLLLVVRGTPFERIWPRLALVTLVAVAVTLLHKYEGMFQESITTKPFALIGLALGIFLGFRNNTSYDRFWEGRKLWGRLVNTTRSTTRQIMTLVGAQPSEAEISMDEIHRELVHRIVGYVHAFRHHLRDEDTDPLEDAVPFLPESEVAGLRGESNIPTAILHRLAERFRELWREGKIDTYHLTVLENSLTTLTDIQGGCERIKSTPIPASYTVLIHRLVATYVFALPFGLVSEIGGYTPEVTVLVAYAFLGLDAIGDEIEMPFGKDRNDLPLGAMSRMIEVNLRQRLGEEDLPPLKKPERGVLY